jgi:hypothetical protein
MVLPSNGEISVTQKRLNFLFRNSSGFLSARETTDLHPKYESVQQQFVRIAKTICPENPHSGPRRNLSDGIITLHPPASASTDKMEQSLSHCRPSLVHLLPRSFLLLIWSLSLICLGHLITSSTFLAVVYFRSKLFEEEIFELLACLRFRAM